MSVNNSVDSPDARGRFRILSGAAALLSVAALCMCLFSCKKSQNEFTAGFYGLTRETKEALRAELTLRATVSGHSVLFVEFDDGSPLAGQIKGKCDVIFAPDGKNARQVMERAAGDKNADKIPLDADSVSGLTGSVRSMAVASGGGILNLPVLTDTWEMLFDTALTAGMAVPGNWDRAEDFALAAKNKGCLMPLIFAGKESDCFLGFFSVLVESVSGQGALERAGSVLGDAFATRAALPADQENALKSSQFTGAEKSVEDAVRSLSENPDSPLYAACRMLTRWLKAGLINNDVFDLTSADVEGFMSARNAAIVFAPLSAHRRWERDTAERYKSLPQLSNQTLPFFPSRLELGRRHLIAGTVMALPVSGNAAMKSTVLTLASSTDAQENLSRGSGLAPVNARARTPDIQADDARFWIAASGAPSPSLAYTACASPAERDILKDAIVRYIKSL